MQRFDAKSSRNSRFVGETTPRKLTPDPRGHAALLVQAYGRERALQIAQTNRSVAVDDLYWSEVFEALHDDVSTPAAVMAPPVEDGVRAPARG